MHAAATSGLSVLVLVAAALASPYYPHPQTRQLYYPGLPQPQPQYSPYPVPLALPYRQLFYPQPAAANYIAAQPSFRYPTHTLPLAPAAPAKQVLYYPSPNPYTGNYVLAGDESNAAQNWGEWISSFFYPSSPATNAEAEQPAKPAEAETPAAATAEKGDKPAEEEVKVEEPAKPAEETKAKLKDGPQNYVLVGQPQFYGSYGLQRLNPAAVLPSANHGAVSSYLLLKNFPGVKFAPFPQAPLVPQAAPQPGPEADAELVPGSAALGYQKLLQAAQASRQQKEYEDAVSVDAAAVQRDSLPQDDKPAETAESETETDGEKETEDETGISE